MSPSETITMSLLLQSERPTLSITRPSQRPRRASHQSGMTDVVDGLTEISNLLKRACLLKLGSVEHCTCVAQMLKIISDSQKSLTQFSRLFRVRILHESPVAREYARMFGIELEEHPTTSPREIILPGSPFSTNTHARFDERLETALLFNPIPGVRGDLVDKIGVVWNIDLQRVRVCASHS